jgi:hypothetical protein
MLLIIVKKNGSNLNIEKKIEIHRVHRMLPTQRTRRGGTFWKNLEKMRALIHMAEYRVVHFL